MFWKCLGAKFKWLKNKKKQHRGENWNTIMYAWSPQMSSVVLNLCCLWFCSQCQGRNASEWLAFWRLLCRGPGLFKKLQLWVMFMSSFSIFQILLFWPSAKPNRLVSSSLGRSFFWACAKSQHSRSAGESIWFYLCLQSIAMICYHSVACSDRIRSSWCWFWGPQKIQWPSDLILSIFF